LRRARQLERAKEQLSQEVVRGHRTADAMRMLESRFQLVSNALPSLIFFVDREQHCRFYNRAFEIKTRLPGKRITGRLLQDVVGDAVYASIAPHVQDALSGKVVEYEIVWESRGSEELAYTVRHIPYPPDSTEPIGFYILATAVLRAHAPVREIAGNKPARVAAGTPGMVMDDNDAIFIGSFTDDLTGWGDPRADLVRALEQDHFLLFAQKILPLKGNFHDERCYEILLRLKEEEENMLPPGNFIPIAERYGLMEQIDRWVVRRLIAWSLEKCKHHPAWHVPLFCINLSESAITSRQFPRFVLEELKRTGFAAHSLCFEIGEQDAIHRNSEVRHFIASLKPAGCRFAIDAFGSIKVSFSHLRNLPIDFVKIDGAIIQAMLSDSTALANVRGINSVCQKVGIRTVAKFVETGQTLDKLREIGVDYVQGFCISHPEPIEKLS
jgi:EAL domain-containing protein (putative c-di-GMP-specific phosphodiesterase class I)/PAS domain-containing protein